MSCLLLSATKVVRWKKGHISTKLGRSRRLSDEDKENSICDGVVKTLHFVRCYNFLIITTYRMYAEIIGKLHASNMKLFTYPSKIEVFTSLSYVTIQYREQLQLDSRRH